MSDPVDTDALRELLVLGAPPLSAPAAGHDKWVGQVRIAGAAAADELDRLRAVIEDAPHGDDCPDRFTWRDDATLPCNCWKTDATLDGT